MSTRPAVLGPGAALLAAAVGSVGSRRAPEVYARLDKPSWAPPSSLFGPVWSVLYLLIGGAGWRLWSRGARRRTRSLHLAQLALNAAWPWTFFAIRDKRLSLAVIAALDALLVLEVADLSREDRVAAAELAPYLAWSLFATALNATVEDPS